ncbi:tetraspanin-8-like [Sphaeramia orbicularis]|uniref:Tetraspanin-8-like n=1 Tax=Sphaeramia orbicularis TaxID=375764 RepID=A0A672ZZA9_9TELE|nr:tetraspanin-8-like [Sphaeramia orbicularis]
MGKINGCLKCLFIFFNVVFAIIGCILIFGVVKATAVSSQLSTLGTPGIGWGWLFAIGVLSISCLGIYAGCSEKALAFKIFAGFMIAGIIIMMSFGIYVVVVRNKIKNAFLIVSSEASQTLMQEDSFRQYLDGMQSVSSCCGLTSADDWGSTIPDSCACSGGYGQYGIYSGSGCRDKPQGTSGPSQIYIQSCGDFLFFAVDLFCKILMGIFFGFAVSALLGLLMSLLMLHQIKRYDGAGGASFSMKG